MLQQLLWLSIAGALGALARYALSGLTQHLYGDSFPWGTLVVNALGCLLFGIVWALADERLMLAPNLRLIVLTGFMGAFTTFSTFIFETGELLRASEWVLAAGNLTMQIVIGLLFLFLGVTAGRGI